MVRNMKVILLSWLDTWGHRSRGECWASIKVSSSHSHKKSAPVVFFSTWSGHIAAYNELSFMLSRCRPCCKSQLQSINVKLFTQSENDLVFPNVNLSLVPLVLFHSGYFIMFLNAILSMCDQNPFRFLLRKSTALIWIYREDFCGMKRNWISQTKFPLKVLPVRLRVNFKPIK